MFYPSIRAASAQAAIASILASGVPARTPQPAEHPISWTLSSSAATVRQGERIPVRLHALIPAGWHLYSMTDLPSGPVATAISVAPGGEFVLVAKPTARDPDVHPPDVNFPFATETYSDSVTFTVPVAARTAGKRQLVLRVYYEACTETYCLPPTTDAVALTLQVTPSAEVAVAIAAPPPPPPPQLRGTPGPPASGGGSVPAGGTTQSLPLFLWLAAVMGALSLVTPCVFPMIPITVSYFTRSNETARGSPTRNALVYAAGIMATFTGLGLAIAVLVGAGGINRFAANPWINLLVTAIFVAFALNLFGVYQIALPASLLTRLDRATRRTGGSETAGIVLMGLTFTLTSFTCTAPFVGTVLVMAAQGNWLWPLAGLLVFSAVFALPFFLLALMPSAVARLPRSGSWLQSVKVMMGFVELATAMKFLSNADLVLRWGVFTRTVVLVVWLGIALIAAAYLLGVTGWFAPATRRPITAARLVAAVMTLAIAVYVARGLGGRRLGELEAFVPPAEGAVLSGVTSAPGELSWWINDYDAGLAAAKAAHRPMMLDFTGYTCTNCRWMEANMFPRKDVARELGKYVRVRLYTDGQGELFDRQQRMEEAKLGTVALPYYAIVDTLGEVQKQFRGMTRNSREFVEFLSPGRSSSTP